MTCQNFPPEGKSGIQRPADGQFGNPTFLGGLAFFLGGSIVVVESSVTCGPVLTCICATTAANAFHALPDDRVPDKLSTMSHLSRAIEESVTTLRSLSALEEPLQRAAQLILRSLLSGKKLLICGNGGSASDATHLATEFLCRFKEDRRPYPAISLTANGEFMTAVCNDYHADEIFARQVWGLAEKGDVLIGITTSGKSKNILRALEEASRKGVESIAILGRNGGFTKGVATVDLIVPGTSTARIQEGQKVLYHALCEIIEDSLPKA